jgi:hypothetical protein
MLTIGLSVMMLILLAFTVLMASLSIVQETHGERFFFAIILSLFLFCDTVAIVTICYINK